MKPTKAEIGSIIVTFLFIVFAAIVLLSGESAKSGEAFTIKTSKTPPTESLLSDVSVPSSLGETSPSSGKVNINDATKEDLCALFGIGDSLSQAIIEYRLQNGPFSDIEDIMLVPGIGESKFNDIREYISVQ